MLAATGRGTLLTRLLSPRRIKRVGQAGVVDAGPQQVALAGHVDDPESRDDVECEFSGRDLPDPSYSLDISAPFP